MRSDGRGILYVVGLGPGSPGLLTPDASAALDTADTIVGYSGYLDLISDRLAGKEVVSRALGEEVERARAALELAGAGHTVALVSSGDAGVYGMASVACELAARRDSSSEIIIVPGVTAAFSAAALLGAPLSHDWAAISLSDRLTPWGEIVRRIEAVALADFVVVFYNPASQARTWQLSAAAERLLAHRNPATPVGLVENAYRPGQRIEILRLDALASTNVSMFTTLIVGNRSTYISQGRMITPRIRASNVERPEAPIIDRTRAERASIMAESIAIIDRELGTHPTDPAERAVVRRMIHATADFDFARTVQFSPGAIAAAVSAFKNGAPVVADVEMLRAGIRRDLAKPLGVTAVCSLDEPESALLAASEGITRSAAGLRLSSVCVGDGVVVAIGNAPTALLEAIRLIEEEGWRPACVVGIPVGFVGVEEAKRRLCAQNQVPFVTSLGRKGGTAVTAAAVNALFELAGNRGAP